MITVASPPAASITATCASLPGSPDARRKARTGAVRRPPGTGVGGSVCEGPRRHAVPEPDLTVVPVGLEIHPCDTERDSHAVGMKLGIGQRCVSSEIVWCHGCEARASAQGRYPPSSAPPRRLIIGTRPHPRRLRGSGRGAPEPSEPPSVPIGGGLLAIDARGG